MFYYFQQLKIIFFIAVLCAVFSLFPVNNTKAGIIDDLKGKISGRSSEIQKLEKEIEEYQAELEDIGEEKQTLQKELKTIDVTRQKLSTDIKVTENKVEASSFTIEKLNIEIIVKLFVNVIPASSVIDSNEIHGIKHFRSV